MTINLSHAHIESSVPFVDREKVERGKMKTRKRC